MLKNQHHKGVLGIIPARYHSSRLEGKPLAIIDGKPMIQHVYERASEVLDQLLVATDDKRIADAVHAFNGDVIMTDANHTTGTNRCLDALNKWEQDGNQASIIINIQGDEPLLNTSHLEQLIDCFGDPSTSISTLALKIKPGENLEEGKVFLTKDEHNFALYFSRYPIPYNRDLPKEKWSNNHQYYQHIGIYGFRKDSLVRFANMNESPLEISEKLEQLRWLEAGEKIKVTVTDKYSQPVDTKEDLEKVRTIFQSKGE